MKKICSILKIGYNNSFTERFGEKNLSGDSGRNSNESITARDRRTIPSEIKEQIRKSEYYLKLIEHLKY